MHACMQTLYKNIQILIGIPNSSTKTHCYSFQDIVFDNGHDEFFGPMVIGVVDSISLC